MTNRTEIVSKSLTFLQRFNLLRGHHKSEIADYAIDEAVSRGIEFSEKQKIRLRKKLRGLNKNEEDFTVLEAQLIGYGIDYLLNDLDTNAYYSAYFDKTKYAEKRERECVEMYENGIEIESIASKVGMTFSNIYKVLRRNNCNCSRNNGYNKIIKESAPKRKRKGVLGI